MVKKQILVREFNKLKAVNRLLFHVPSMSARIEMDSRLYQGRDHIPFASSRGEYRTLRLRFMSDPKEETGRLLRIYYGPWRTPKDHYIVLTKGRDILLEIGFTLTNRSIQISNNSLLIRHLIRFSKRKSANNAALVAAAMKRAEKLRLNLDSRNKAVYLRRIDLKRRRSVPLSDQEVIKRFVLSGLAKRGELWTAGKRLASSRMVGKNSADTEAWPGAANPKYKKKMVKFEVNIEKKAQNHKRHQAIINLVKRELESQGYSCNATPEDLRAQKSKAKWIFEVKAWDPDLEVSAIWHAIGQVKWYCFKKPNYQPAIVLAHQPNVDSVNFVEKQCKMPLLWANLKNRTLTGGLLAKKEFFL